MTRHKILIAGLLASSRLFVCKNTYLFHYLQTFAPFLSLSRAEIVFTYS